MATCVIDRPTRSDADVKSDAAFPTMLVILFFVTYTQGYIERIGVPSGIVKMLTEAPVCLIMLHLMNRGMRQCAPGFFCILFYVIWTIVSAIYNGDEMRHAFLYCRYVLYAYIVFAAVWATPLRGTTVTRINTIIALLFVFQIAASAHEVFVRGERVEAHVGALYADGGALATEFPLLAMGLTVPFYLYWRDNLLLLLLAWAFFLVGFASGKRAIYFFAPSFYLFMLGWYVTRARSLPALKRSLKAVSIFMLLTPILMFGISVSHGISDKYSGSWSERVVYAWTEAVKYTLRERSAGRTTGRMATNRRVLSTLWTAPVETRIFGCGPASGRIGEEERYGSLMITYGICGWAQQVICIGWPGMCFYFLFHLRMLVYLWSRAPPGRSGYWMAIRFGAEIGFVVMLISYISYSPSFINGGQLSYVYFYVLALLMSPQHRDLIRSASQTEQENG